MSASTQSDSDHQHEPEADQNLPDSHGIDQGSDGVIKQDDILLRSTSLLRSINSTVAADSVYQAPLDLAGSKLDINIARYINPHDDEQSYHTRPNRWYGADSTWLSWTQDDRLVAQSLDRVRSQDLSIHLYNAYALNAGVHSSRQGRRALSKGKTPIRPDQTFQDDHPGLLNTPQAWAAWPLPPEQVPREPLLPQTSYGGVYSLQDDYRLSAPLEECIIATTMRIARQRWDARASLPEFPTKRNWGIKVEDGVADNSIDADLPQASDDEDSPAESDLVETIVSGPGSSASESAGEQMFTSQVYDLGLDMDEDERKDDKNPTSDVESSVDQRPVPMVDDEKAKAILLPGARHILSKIDDLLMGLHQARHVYATVPLRRKLGVPGVEENSPEEHSDTKASSKAYHRRGRKRRRGRGRSVSVTTNVSATSKSTDSGGGKGRKDRWRTLQPRGWSDVVGMAALTGWNPDVIERASRRCANLFSQNMLFRTFHEGDRTKNQDSYFTEFEALDDDDDDDGTSDVSGPESHFESLTRMFRTSRPCDECLQQKEICKAQDDAVKRDSACKRCQELRIPCSGIVAKFLHNHPPTCPYLECARHDLPFRKAYHLQRHIDSVHRDDPPPDAGFAVPSIESQILTQSQLFSSQSHKIICPVVTCLRHKHPFRRGARLYQHIRNMHPDIDIEEVKKLESKRRGEKRGRYRDESRRSQVGRANRSRSKSVVPPADTSSSSTEE